MNGNRRTGQVPPTPDLVKGGRRVSGAIGLIVKRPTSVRSGALAGCCAVHIVIVACVAWYCVDAVWTSAPIGASAAPLSPLVFQAAWIAGAVVLLAIGPAFGGGAIRGPWIGADPTWTLPVGFVATGAVAWAGAVARMAVVALAPVPVYIAVHAMGGIDIVHLAVGVTVQAAAVALAPLAGVVWSLWRDRVAHARAADD